MTTLEVLRKTRELLSDSTRWAQGYYAYSEGGARVDPDSNLAARFCLLGAMWNVSGSLGRAQQIGAELYGSHQVLAGFNDSCGYHTVVSWLDREIAMLALDEGAPAEDVSVEIVEERELVLA